MMNVCFQCGLYRVDKVIDPVGPYAICPECGYKHSFLQLPLLIVSGASGAGKSAVCRHLLGRLNHVVLLDLDILWRPEFNTPENNYRDFFETWLRVCKNIAQSGRPVVLFGAGAGVPANIEPCLERRYFSAVQYLGLVCADETLADRLRQRPVWRSAQAPAFIYEQMEFNRWFKLRDKRLHPVIDTTDLSIEDTAQQVTGWIDESLSQIPILRRNVSL
jgi:hypothetical protein